MKEKPTPKRKRSRSRSTSRRILSANVKVRKMPSRDTGSLFRLNNDKGTSTPERVISTCTIIEPCDELQGEEYIIFKKRANGTWELILTEDAIRDFDSVTSISILHDRNVKNL